MFYRPNTQSLSFLGGSQHCNDKFDIHIPFFTGAGDVWFSLKGTTYQNKSNMTLEDIGEGFDALRCMTNQTACCRSSDIGGNMFVLGNWFFPNGSRVSSLCNQWDFYRTRGHMVVRLHRRRGGMEGIYCCEIPDTFGLIQTLYIGVYSANTGVWCMCILRHTVQRETWSEFLFGNLAIWDNVAKLNPHQFLNSTLSADHLAILYLYQGKTDLYLRLDLAVSEF